MTPQRIATLPLLLACAALLGACGGMPMGPGRPGATASLVPTQAVSPNATVGNVSFTPLDHGVRVSFRPTLGRGAGLSVSLAF